MFSFYRSSPLPLRSSNSGYKYSFLWSVSNCIIYAQGSRLGNRRPKSHWREMEQQFRSVTSINILISLLFVFAWYRLSDIVKHADIKLHVTELYYYYCLMEQNYPSQNQKSYVPGFSPKHFTILSRNMDTKHTTSEQITGN
jgi:hypothetical protein